MTQIDVERLNNGLTLLVERIEGVASVGMTMLLPAGVSNEPADHQGVAAVLGEMIFRGAGELDARAHCDAMDQLGIQRGCEPSTQHLALTASFLGERFDQAMPLLMDMVRRPRLAEESFHPSRELAMQAIDALEDQPQQKALLRLRQCYLAEPFGRSPMGRRDHLETLSVDHVRQFAAEQFVPGGGILALAGDVRMEQVRPMIERLLGDWSGAARPPQPSQPVLPGYHHEPARSAQQHIGLACGAPPERDPLSMTQRLAVAVLSGGMSSRLFSEVREKRGLCYAVYAAYGSIHDRGAVYAYAGTTTQRAAETLDVMQAELARLSDGVTREEFDRAVVGLKARLVMQGESTSARATAIASDQYLRGQVRTLDEIAREVEAVSLDDLNAFVAAHRLQQFTVLSIGPEPLMPHPSA